MIVKDSATRCFLEDAIALKFRIFGGNLVRTASGSSNTPVIYSGKYVATRTFSNFS
jgi:hypothetical protein